MKSTFPSEACKESAWIRTFYRKNWASTRKPSGVSCKQAWYGSGHRNHGPKERIDNQALQQTYRRMLAEGPFLNQTELSRHLGVSRVWVIRVLKGVKKKVG